MLAVDLAEVSDKECVLIAGLAELGVNALHTLAEGLTNHLFGDQLAVGKAVGVIIVLQGAIIDGVQAVGLTL